VESQTSDELDQVFAALAHPVRRAILAQCGESRQTIAALADPHAMSLNAISKHIKTLESAKLVVRERDGNYHRIAARPEALQMAEGWLNYHASLWAQSLAVLKNKLESTQ